MGLLSNVKPTIQLSRQLDIFNIFPAKIHHLLNFSNLEPCRFKYHISYRDIGAKSILYHQVNWSNLRYYSGPLSNEKPTIQLSCLKQLDIFNPIPVKFYHLLNFLNLEPCRFKYHIFLYGNRDTTQSFHSYMLSSKFKDYVFILVRLVIKTICMIAQRIIFFKFIIKYH